MLELVGADGKTGTRAAQSFEQLPHAIVGLAAHGYVIRVKAEKAIVQAAELRLAYGHAVVAQTGVEHDARTIADERPQLCHAHGLEPSACECVVGGGGQIRRGVDERAVEIEDNGSIAQLHICGACVKGLRDRQAIGVLAACHLADARQRTLAPGAMQAYTMMLKPFMARSRGASGR